MKRYNRLPTISIIIPVYNAEKYIHCCIESVLRQTFQDFELILVDDGSIDRSGEICDEYVNKDKRIKVIHQKNAGVSSARNVGLHVAQGKYIAFCDSDDELLPDYLAIMINEPEKAELLIAGYQYIDENGEIMYSPHGYLKNEHIIVNESNVVNLIINEKIDYVFGKRFLSRIIRENQITFDNAENFGEDTLFVIAYLFCCHSVEIKKNIIYNYRNHEGNRLTGFSKSQYARLKSSNEKMIQIIEERFPDFHNKFVWRKRLWSIAYYSILSILGTKKISLANKRVLIKGILWDKDFSSLIPEIKSFYPKGNKILIRLFQMRSAELLVIYWELTRIKKWIKKVLISFSKFLRQVSIHFFVLL